MEFRTFDHSGFKNLKLRPFRKQIVLPSERMTSPLRTPVTMNNLRNGANRIPHKYDHMHDKTYLTDFVSTQINHEFKFPYLITGKKLAPMDRVRTRSVSPAPQKSQRLRTVRQLSPLRTKSSNITTNRIKIPVSKPKVL